MRQGTLSSLVLMAALVCICRVGPAAAQQLPDGYVVGTHIVREGDTLRAITTAYLGSEDRWQENWKLNPGVKNPDLLYPLQRLRVLLAPRVARPTARLTTISGDVEGKPAPSDWYRSEEDDLMLERDGVRAGRNSSTVMRFSDGSDLTLKDESTVFLRVAGRSLRGFEQRSVEIVEGQADLAAVERPLQSKIEVVVGSATATPLSGESGGFETRARRVEEGGAQVMIFEGMGEVVAAGTAVTVPSGMGTAVPSAGPPAPPEKLLSAAVGLTPEPGEEIELERDRFSWEPVEGAASYSVELCRDVSCGSLVVRQTGLAEPRWESTGLPTGEYLWRVTAVSVSGLDGYASESQRVRINPLRVDTQAPTGELVVVGRSAERQGVTYYGPDLEVRLDVDDDVTGVDFAVLKVNGREVEARELRGPWETGEYEISATAADGAGNEAAFGPLEIRIDADPPEVDAATGGAELLPSEVAVAWSRKSEDWAESEIKNVLRWGRRPRWTPLDQAVLGRSSRGRGIPNPLRTRPLLSRRAVDRERVALVLFAPALLFGHDAEPLGQKLLSLAVEDEGSGMVEFEIRQRTGPDAWNWLELLAADRLGNQIVRRWHFALRSDSRWSERGSEGQPR